MNLADFPNLEAILCGAISGRFSDWPLVAPELRRYEAGVTKLQNDYQAGVTRVLELEEELATSERHRVGLIQDVNNLERGQRALQGQVTKQLEVLKTCAGLAARLEQAEDTILCLQEIAWSRIKLGGSAYTNAAVDRFQQMSNRLEDHRHLMDAKLAADDLAQKLNGSHETPP